MTILIMGCSVLIVVVVYVCVEILRTQKVFTVTWDSQRKDKRAPLLWRMFLATRVIVFQGRII